jgi:hypothetical protein
VNKNVWESDTKYAISEQVVLALRAMAIGYGYVRKDHGAVLRSFGLCFYHSPADGWRISEEGKKCLEVWDAGFDYDFATEDRRHTGKQRPGEIET